uniref:Uncharacterized protein n=1 Tax=Anguilla anguilla TaxID=7936 RepID=A0A0E9X2D2_ANGAN
MRKLRLTITVEEVGVLPEGAMGAVFERAVLLCSYSHQLGQGNSHLLICIRVYTTSSTSSTCCISRR